MAESQNSTLFRNLCFLHLQRLTLELKCPLCLKLLKNPVVFPCNHIFCNGCIAMSNQNRQNCPSCELQCLHQEIRSAPYMESIVRLCQSLEETLNAKCYQPSSAGMLSEQTPNSIDMGSNSRKEYPSEILRKRIYSQLDDSVNSTKGETNSKKLRAAVCEEVKRIPDCIIITDGEGVNTMIKKEIKKEYWKGDSVKSFNGGTYSKKFRRSPDYVIIDDEDVDITIKEELQTEDCKVAGGNGKFPDRESQVLRNASDKKLDDNEPGVARADSHHMPAVQPEKTVTWSTTKKPNKYDFAANQSALESDRTSKQGVHCSKSIKELSHNVKSTKHRLVRHSRPSSSTPNIHRSVCAFCHSSEQNDGTGRLIGYADKKEIDLTSLSNFDRSKVLIGHEKCVYWSPQVFFENDNIENLESEVARAAKLKCSSCGKKGAGLGCYVENCQKTYHVPCAYFMPEIRWDCENYLMLCPSHISCKFPGEMSEPEECSNGESHPLPSKITSEKSDFRAKMPDGMNELVLHGSALSAEDKTQFENFATKYRVNVSKSWNRDITHVIASTDATGACIRTFEFLMAILNGKWIVKIDWIKACTNANRLLDELDYEIRLENHGFHNGPKIGRLSFSENGPKLFAGLRFYFFGDFEPDELNELLELVEAAGGITESKEGMMASQVGAASKSRYLVYNCNPPQGNPLGDTCFLHQRIREAVDVAVEIGAGVLRHKWISDSIAGFKLVTFP